MVSADGTKAQVLDAGLFRVYPQGDTANPFTVDTNGICQLYGNNSTFFPGLIMRATSDTTTGQIKLLKSNNVNGSKI